VVAGWGRGVVGERGRRCVEQREPHVAVGEGKHKETPEGYTQHVNVTKPPGPVGRPLRVYQRDLRYLQQSAQSMQRNDYFASETQLLPQVCLTRGKSAHEKGRSSSGRVAYPDLAVRVAEHPRLWWRSLQLLNMGCGRERQGAVPASLVNLTFASGEAACLT
jgi:hypothetical protein